MSCPVSERLYPQALEIPADPTQSSEALREVRTMSTQTHPTSLWHLRRMEGGSAKAARLVEPLTASASRTFKLVPLRMQLRHHLREGELLG